MQSPDLLIPLWATHGRDFEALLPVAWYCEHKLGMTVALRSMFDVHEVHRLRPRIVLISSSTGSMRCVDLVRCTYASNIPTVSLTAEGDFKPEMIEQMFWGLNTDRFLYEDLTLQWSERTRRMTLARYPELADRIRVSGAVGFDRYKIYKFMSRDAFLAKYASRPYDLVVGYAGYGFDRLHMPQLQPQYQEIHGRAGLERMMADGEKVRQVLRETIQSYPQILFVLKYHPGTLDKTKTELYELDQLPNTVVLWQEEIADIISACDLWTAYDSTTVLEAWLLGKTTLMINPSGPDFVRTQIHQGAGVVQTAEELAAAISEWQCTDRVDQFEAREPERRRIIRDTIQWDDGLNHVRVARIVTEMLQNPRPYKRPTSSSYLHWWGIHRLIRMAHIVPQLVPIRRLRRVSHLFSLAELEAVKERYYPQLAAFHERRAQCDVGEAQNAR